MSRSAVLEKGYISKNDNDNSKVNYFVFDSKLGFYNANDKLIVLTHIFCR